MQHDRQPLQARHRRRTAVAHGCPPGDRSGYRCPCAESYAGAWPPGIRPHRISNDRNRDHYVVCAICATTAILILIFGGLRAWASGTSGRGLDDYGGSGGGLAKASVRSKSSQEGKIRNAVIAASLLKKL